MERAREFFGNWATKHTIISTLTDSLLEMGEDFLRICIQGIGQGHNLHLDCSEMKETLKNYKDWISLIPTGQYGATRKMKPNVTVLGEIVCRLEYYENNPAARSAIEAKIKAARAGNSLNEFVRGILIFFVTQNYFKYTFSFKLNYN